MLYHRQNKNLKFFGSARFLITTILFFAILIIGIFNPKIITKPIQNMAIHFSIVKKGVFDGISNFIYSFENKTKLAKENEILKNNIKNLNTIYLAKIENLKIQNQELEKTLGRIGKTEEKNLGTAYIIAKPPITNYNTFAIDLGKNSGLKVGDLALVGNYLIGTISETFDDISLIKIFGGYNEEMPLIIGEKRIALTGKGNGLGSYKIIIPNEMITEKNVTTRLANAPDYIFGTIIEPSQVEKSKGEEFIVKSPINLFEVGELEIISYGKK